MAYRNRISAAESAEHQFICKELEGMRHYEEASQALHRTLQDKDRQNRMLHSMHSDECERSAAMSQQLRRVEATNAFLGKRSVPFQA